MLSPREQYARTFCDCAACGAHCRNVPGMLIPGDIERIAAFIETTPQQVLAEHLEASPGALVGRLSQYTGRVTKFRVPTIVPRTLDDRCVFLDVHGQCEIYPAAPYGCSHFDSHMGELAGLERSKAGLVAIMKSEEYKVAWRQLVDAGKIGLSPEAKRKIAFGEICR